MALLDNSMFNPGQIVFLRSGSPYMMVRADVPQPTDGYVRVEMSNGAGISRYEIRSDALTTEQKPGYIPNGQQIDFGPWLFALR